MAKGLRAKSKQANKAKLRKNVFGPVETQRMERLSAKLAEIVTQERPARPSDQAMDVEKGSEENTSSAKSVKGSKSSSEDAMDVDGESALKRKRVDSGRIQKRVPKRKAPRKAKNSVVFKSFSERRADGRRRPKK